MKLAALNNRMDASKKEAPEEQQLFPAVAHVSGSSRWFWDTHISRRSGLSRKKRKQKRGRGQGAARKRKIT
jgi:hypothetical protein